MQTKVKLALLQLVGGLFGWVWIIASLASVYLFVAALFFGGAWSRFLWAFAIAGVGKWLLVGFRDNQHRVALVDGLKAKGMSDEEAHVAWALAYSGQPAQAEAPRSALSVAHNLIADYGDVLERCSGELLFDESELPASKADIEAAIILAAVTTSRAGDATRTDQLRTGFAYLANFVSADLAASVRPLSTMHDDIDFGGPDGLTPEYIERLRQALESSTNTAPAQRQANEDFLQQIRKFDARLLEAQREEASKGTVAAV